MSFDASPYRVSEHVQFSLTLGELRAIAYVLGQTWICSGGCGDVECETFGYVLEQAKSSVKRALFDAVDYGLPEDVLDRHAVETARMDQWRAELHERGAL